MTEHADKEVFWVVVRFGTALGALVDDIFNGEWMEIWRGWSGEENVVLFCNTYRIST